MADTISQLLDELYREWLEPPSDGAIQASLSAGITRDATSLVYLDAYLAPEEQYLLAPGTLIEVGSELMRIGETNTATNTISGLVRGAEGTKASPHSAGDAVKLNPRFPRSTLFNLTKSAIQGLWPPLYAVKTATLTGSSDGAPVALPVDFIQPMRAIRTDNYDQTPIRVLNPYSLVASGKAAIFPEAPTEIHLSYRAATVAPTSETDYLLDLGVRPSWHRIIKVDVVLDAASNDDIDKLTPEFLKNRIELEASPILAASEIRQRLIGYREYLVERAVAQLDHEYGHLLSVSVDRTFR